MTGFTQGEKNPIEAAIESLGVTLPDHSQDLSGAVRSTGVAKFYVLITTARIGSTWLAGLLRQIEGVGNPVEYFSEEGLRSYGPSPIYSSG